MAEPIAGGLHADKYWLTPSGEIIIVKDRHVVNVVTQPEMFGTTKEELEAKYGDITTSLQSREEIIEDFTNRGYTRIRKLKGKQGSSWTVQVGTGGGRKIPRNVKNAVVNWAMSMMKTAQKFAKEDVMVFNEQAELLFGGNTPSTRKTLEQLVLDDTGVFESCVYETENVECSRWNAVERNNTSNKKTFTADGYDNAKKWVEDNLDSAIEWTIYCDELDDEPQQDDSILEALQKYY